MNDFTIVTAVNSTQLLSFQHIKFPTDQFSFFSNPLLSSSKKFVKISSQTRNQFIPRIDQKSPINNRCSFILHMLLILIMNASRDEAFFFPSKEGESFFHNFLVASKKSSSSFLLLSRGSFPSFSSFPVFCVHRDKKENKAREANWK